ncbi:MAG: sugar ABC transporter ATP-binding protein [Acidobacteriota bacterium]
MSGPKSYRLRMEGISKRFGATVALDGVDLQVQAGEVHALVGENGAGKSTLMKILAGAYRPDSGRIWIDEVPYEPKSPLEGRRAGVAMIYQELSLAPHLSIEENILLGMEPCRGPWLRRDELLSRARQAMEQLGLQHRHPGERVSGLSVAEQQLVELARAVAVGCRILVLDEPTSSLTARDIERLFALIRELRGKGYAVVYISHFLEEVTRVSDRYTVLRDGKVAGRGRTAETSPAQLAAQMVGRAVDDLYRRSARQPGEVLLEAEGLQGPVLLREAGFQLRRGEVLGIAGLVGAGRTELLRAIFGLAPVQAGRIRIGAYFGPGSPYQRWRQGVGLLPEDRKTEGLALNLTVIDNLTLSKLEGLGPANLVLPDRQEQAARPWLETLNIRCRSPHQRIYELSGGNQQKVALARLLYHDVDVLLLDEPTRGIDVGSKAEIYRLIDRLAAGDPERGRPAKAVLMVSSYLPELLGVCDRIAVMCRGRLGPARENRNLTEHQLMLEATGTG